MNFVLMSGNIASEINSKDAGGTTFAGFTLAVNRYTKDNQKKASFFRVKFSGKKAEAIVKFFKKGMPILIQGELSQEKWKDDDVVLVFGRNFEFMSKKDSDSSEPDNSDGLWG